MTDTPIIKKIPGRFVKFDHQKDGFVDLTSKSKTELIDLIAREKKLLENRKFLENLPDKGNKIRNFYNNLQIELEKREKTENLCSLLANLNVTDSKEAINKLEWTGKPKLSVNKAKSNGLEEETDPFKILATHSGVSTSKEKQIIKQEKETLITSSDIEEECTSYLSIDLYAEQLCHRFDKSTENEGRKKFYPNKSLNRTFCKSVTKEKEPEISAAYIPRNIASNNTRTKLLSLEDSIKIYDEQTKRLKEIELRHAMEKLMQKSEIKMGTPQNIGDYRNPHNEDTDEGSCYVTNENSEDEDDDSDTAVFYNIIDTDPND